MSEATLERAWASFDAFNRGDHESRIGGFAEDVEIHDLAESPEGGAFRGHAGLRSWLAQMHEAWGDSLRLEPMSFIDGGDVVLAEVKGHGSRGQQRRPDRGDRVFRHPVARRQGRVVKELSEPS
jgi:ketosteroid isomerase-like protein